MTSRSRHVLFADPLAAAVESRSARGLILTWPQVLLCGIPSSSFQGGVLYALEVAEGYEVVAVAKYAPEQNDLDFRLVCR